ncbi:DUF6671 family protein [Phycicoccus duodecadis]|uniref:DUF6671 domain-containing protein n=1 Tax=Phycicoccus duodecadis TaxID=173053 RepID=A0A2N3YI41_9MICO|nr:DUF6671 family protein [Phycicoccus duodecadis]PKW26488.1 hypothetical protein ATL31_1299 [Phycicoccus duodecadis]
MTSIDTTSRPEPRAPGRPRPYVGRPVVMATQHGKAEVVRDLFAAVGLHVIPVAVDTDRFGTFTPEVPRPAGAQAAAEAKARAGAAAGGLPLALASEGSFTPDPDTGLVVQHELLAFLDTESGLTLTGRATGHAPWARSWTVDPDATAALDRVLAQVDLTRTRLVARPDPAAATAPDAAGGAGITKGLGSPESLRDAVRHAARWSSRVVVETDLRADRAPERHPVIRRAAVDLIHRLHTPCPACGRLGFGPDEHTGHAPCSGCGTPTARPTHVVRRCPHCSHEVLDAAAPATAGPGDCPACNP